METSTQTKDDMENLIAELLSEFTQRIVAVIPKIIFRPIFEVATTKQDSDVILLKEPPELHDPEARCLWWRRGRVDCLQFAAHTYYPPCW